MVYRKQNYFFNGKWKYKYGLLYFDFKKLESTEKKFYYYIIIKGIVFEWPSNVIEISG